MRDGNDFTRSEAQIQQPLAILLRAVEAFDTNGPV